MGDVQVAALRRASKFGFENTLEDSDLQTIGPKPISMFPEDSLQDMVNETADNTFKLCSMAVNSPSDLTNTTTLAFREKQEEETNLLVYIRWITLEDALLNAQITTIQVDHSPLLQSDSLSKLYDTAANKFLHVQSGTANGKINLYLKECSLVAESNPVTFATLGLHGSKEFPLEVFIDIVPANVNTTLSDIQDDTDLSTLWASTPR